MENDNARVPVEKSDREMFYWWSANFTTLQDPEEEDAMLQAFARHRLHHSGQVARGEKGVAARLKYDAYGDGRFALYDPAPDNHHSALYLKDPCGALFNISCHNEEGLDIERGKWMVEVLNAALHPSGQVGTQGFSARETACAAMRSYVESAGVPATEFDPEFVVRMMAAMMVSFHKYGRVADAYPLKFDAVSDVRARMKKYRETGNKHFLVDAANFAMIEAMHPARAAEWAGNDATDSPGRTTAEGHRLVQEDNAGNRIMGETILHVPGDGI